MAAGKERIQSRHDDILLPDNHLGHFILQQSNPRRKLVQHHCGIAFDYRRHRVNGVKCCMFSHTLLFVCLVHFVVSPNCYSQVPMAPTANSRRPPAPPAARAVAAARPASPPPSTLLPPVRHVTAPPIRSEEHT